MFQISPAPYIVLYVPPFIQKTVPAGNEFPFLLIKGSVSLGLLGYPYRFPWESTGSPPAGVSEDAGLLGSMR